MTFFARAFVVFIAFAVAGSTSCPADAKTAPPRSPVAARWWAGSSAWMVANALPDPPHFYYLEVGHWLAPRDALVFGAVTWTYRAPIGIPYGDALGDPEQEYPGRVRSFGLGLGWRRTIWEGFNASAHSFHFLQRYEAEARPTRSGYQLFLQGRAGWRWPARARGPWIEPSIAFNWWPIETGRPASFRSRDDRWPSYFLFEPWLNFGWSW